jgi:hypothetical protein
MGMTLTRFGELSGDEKGGISVGDPQSLKRLEHVQTLLMYETAWRRRPRRRSA